MRRSKMQGLLRRLLGGLLCLCMIVSEVGGVAPITAFAAEPQTEATAAPVTAEPAASPVPPEGTDPPVKSTEAPEKSADPLDDTAVTSPAPQKDTEPPIDSAETPEPSESPGPSESPEPTAAPMEPAKASAEPAADTERTESPAPIAAPLPSEDALSEIYVPKAPAGVEGAEEAETLEEAAARLPKGGTIWLTGSAALGEVRFEGKAVTIKSYGEEGPYTLTKAGSAVSENMFSLSNGAALTLENVTVDAAGNTAGRTVSASGSTVTLGAGAALVNNTAFGAVYLDDSVINMEGGAIRNNSASADEDSVKKKYYNESTWRFVFDPDKAGKQSLGGAVLMVNRSTFNMTGGQISENSAICGGGVYAYDFAAMSVTGGDFTGNKADTGTANQAYGGALHVDGTAAGTVRIGGSARFTGNSAQRGGALGLGIDADAVDLTITGGTFEGNSSAAQGSIAFINSKNSIIDISGAAFTGNSALDNGGIYKGAFSGVAATGRGKIVIHDGVRFTDNTALKGPCLYITKDNADAVKEFLVDGAAFTGNSAANDAGVMQYNVPNSTFKIINSTFENNRSENRGGCFYAAVDAKGTAFTFENSTFTGNYAKNQGGVWRGFPPQSEFVFRDCTFTGNTAETGDGGCFYFPGDGPGSNITIDGGSFTGNSSGSSGGAFRANLDGGKVTVTGGAVFTGNSADVNAGAFSIRRRGADYYGQAYLLSCTVDGNWCNANFDNYKESDLEPTRHYNTGGVYIGENITCYMYDALVTGNSVQGGYEGTTVGNGIGLCPNAQVYLYPEHGATICSNGDNGGMDIVAVPYDETIHHETPAKLYVSDTTPDGQAYNWTDLDGKAARTGAYDWTNARSGIAAASIDGSYQGETTLDPVGFKANIGSGVQTVALDSAPFEYSVRIINNYTKSALYAGGGMMVNGTVISGELNVSVQKRTVGLSEEEKAVKDFGFTFTVGNYSGGSSINVPYTLTGRGGTTSGTAAFKYQGSISSSSGGPTYGMQYSFTLKSDQTITFDFQDSDFNFAEKTDYYFWLEETDTDGAEDARITYIAYDEDGNIFGGLGSGSNPDPARKVKRIEFTCTNIFGETTELDLTKTVENDESHISGWKLWNFHIKLAGADGMALSGEYPAELWSSGYRLDSVDGTEYGLRNVGGSWVVGFDRNGEANVKLGGGEILKIFGLPDGTQYTITETDANTGGFSTTDPTKNGTTSTDGPANAAFVNTVYDNGSLTVRKKVAGDAPETDREWSFKIELKDPDGNERHLAGEYSAYLSSVGSRVVTVGEDGVVRIGGEDAIKLKANAYIRIDGLPVGTTYTITEIDSNQGGYTTDPAGGAASGTVRKYGDPGGSVEVEFTNSRVEHGSLTVSKTVAGPGANTNRLWHFQIKLKNDSLEEGLQLKGEYPYEIKPGGASADPPATGYVTVDDDGSVTLQDGSPITLRGGQSITIYGLPVGTTYEVTETDANSGGYTTAPSDQNGNIGKDTASEAKFTNTRQTGSLTVSKTVVGSAGDKEKEWTFQIVLKDSDGSSLPAGEYDYEIKGPGAGDSTKGKVSVDADGSVTIKDPAEKAGAVKLKHGQSITITGLPAGARYTVTEAEANAGGYTTQATGANGTIPEGGMAQADFLNSKDTTPPPTPTPPPGPTPTPGPGPTPTPGTTPPPEKETKHTPPPFTLIPRTGDDSPLLLWMVLLAASALGICVTAFVCRDRKGRKTTRQREKK